jgi:hypothetical protein
MASVFVRPCRSATIRTRLDAETVHSRLSVLVNDGAPEGMSRFFADGFFLGGSVGAKDFQLDYRFNSAKNPQTYSVYGRIQETPDWRIVRLKLTAHAPWLSRWEAFFMALYVGFHIYSRQMPAGAGMVIFAFVLAVYAGANLFYIPDVVTNRVSSILASEVRGSVQTSDGWEVPR